MSLMFCVREGDNVSLACDASGYPPPHIVWRREDGEDILMAGKKLNIVEVINFYRLSSFLNQLCLRVPG